MGANLTRTGHGSRAAGFTLIELLIVVAIIGIIAAVAIPNLMNAIDKSKQKRTMSDQRSISTAVEAYAVDTARYPLGATSWAQLKPVVNPHFIKSPPDVDGWSHGWDAATTADGSEYTISSLGKDGVAGSRPGGPTTDFDCDIVYNNGQFFQWPQGTQS